MLVVFNYYIVGLTKHQLTKLLISIGIRRLHWIVKLLIVSLNRNLTFQVWVGLFGVGVISEGSGHGRRIILPLIVIFCDSLGTVRHLVVGVGSVENFKVSKFNQ